MKEKLIEIARKEKFVSQFFTNDPYKYSLKEDLRYLLWMEELKEWFRSNHNIHVEVYRTIMKKFRADLVYDKNEHVINDRDSCEEELHTYNEALQAGLLMAFEYIKKD